MLLSCASPSYHSSYPLPRRVSQIAHMVDLFATLATAAALSLPEEQQEQLARRIRRKAPHSMSLWHNLRPRSEAAAETFRRQVVLQVSASSSAVLRGRWKLVLASSRCFGIPRSMNQSAVRACVPREQPLPWLRRSFSRHPPAGSREYINARHVSHATYPISPLIFWAFAV